jgi:hypothetical protein
MFENRVLRKVFGAGDRNRQQDRGKYITRTVIIWSLQKVLLW